MTDLPTAVAQELNTFIEAAKLSFGEQLKAVVLYGSGAEGKLRPTSDVNLLVVVSDFEAGRVDSLREPLRLAMAAINLSPMFLLESEVRAATEAFAVKFADVLRRRKVLYGRDPFEGVTISRTAEIARLRQVLLNLNLRMRSTYLSRSLREEQLALALADFAGPLRASAAAILELRGEGQFSPKEALEKLAGSLQLHDISGALARVSEIRQGQVLPPGSAAATAFQLMGLTQRMRDCVEQL